MRFLALVTILIIGCTTKTPEVKAPNRLTGIPEKAFWVGGADGGNWYVVDHIHDHQNNASIRVYNDIDGSLIMSKRFILICPADNQVFLADLEKQINFFDGERIFLIPPNEKAPCFLK